MPWGELRQFRERGAHVGLDFPDTWDLIVIEQIEQPLKDRPVASRIITVAQGLEPERRTAEVMPMPTEQVGE